MAQEEVVRKKLNSIEEARKQIAEDREKSSKYIKLQDGESKVLWFSGNMEYVERPSIFKPGTMSRKYDFEVTDTESQQPKILSMAGRFADEILDKLHTKQKYIKVKRKGTGTNTMYTFENASK